MKPEYFYIPRIVYEDKTLTQYDGYLYAVIYWFERMKDGKCLASNQTLSEVLNSKPGVIQNSLLRLERAGCVKRIFSDKQRKKRIQIKCLIETVKVPLVSGMGTTGELLNVPLVSDQSISTREIRIKNKENTPPTAVQEVIQYFFSLKGWAYKGTDSEKKLFRRYLRPAKDLLELCESDIPAAKECLDKISVWAKSRELDWSIETVFKKWYEIDLLKPKEKKPHWDGCRIFQKVAGGRWWIVRNGEILELGRGLKPEEISWK